MARKSSGPGERHRKIMRFLDEFQADSGYSPSIREIGENINVSSTSLVDYYLKQLEGWKYIERDSHVSRSIRVLKPMAENVTGKFKGAVRGVAAAVKDVFTIPVAGRIVAGMPIPVPASDWSYFDPDSTVEVARSMLPARENIEDLFALEVQGDSMIDAMVSDGDIVIMKRAEGAENGEMVAVWLNDSDETTLKYFYNENTRVRLQPANPTMEPIYINNPKRLRIMGKVLMVIRQMDRDVM